MGANEPRRHHYVPRFLLRRFTEDPGRDGALVRQLEVESGRISATNPTNAAVIRDFYAVVDEEGVRSQEAERLLAVVEENAAPLIATLDTGTTLEGIDRFNLAYFLAILWLRTPRWRERFQYTEEQLSESMLRNARAEHYQASARAQGEEITIAEAELRRQEVIAALDRGGIQVEAGHARHIAILFEHADSSAWMLFRMDWTLVRASADTRFVIADEAVTVSEIEDGRATGPTFPFASTKAEMVFPLDPGFVLALRPSNELLQEIAQDDGRALRDITTEQIEAQLGRPVIWEEREATAEEASEINLRSYAHVERWLYGRDQATLATLHDFATGAEADRVAELRPRDPELVVVHERRSEDPQVWQAPPRPPGRRPRRRP